MKNIKIFAIIYLFIVASCTTKTSEEDKIAAQLKQEIVQDLTENILAFWVKYAPDPAGGFYGTVGSDGTPRENSSKGGVLNARIIWTFSSAYRILKDEQYLALANRAQRYFLDHFIDPVYGGSYMTVAANGDPLDTQKNTYQNAFAVYGLAEHYRATGNKESLDAAIDIYRKIIEYAYDPVKGGLIGCIDCQRLGIYHDREWKFNSELANPKTMNNNLHWLEALTNLYRVWKDPGLKKHLQEQIHVMSNIVLNQKTWHQHCFLTMDWENLREVDSMGHDIEFSWLLVEAAEVLGDEEIIKDTRRIAVNLATVQLEEGIDERGAMILDKEDGQLRGGSLSWWVQSETVVGFVNAWQISGDKKFLDAAVRTWEWIKTYLIDYEYGEWNSNASYNQQRRDNGREGGGGGSKVSQFRCPYHNGRMGMEIMTRIP